mmetsp:Transcript_48763/g.122688  ORF Transcript_48763/g.122688 Transcript_48763/m.122688 type:complete len:209 (+) Transcript_48763:69-695(+)
MAEGKELESLSFKRLIGGPLAAVIEAQANAAMVTYDFIKRVGFAPNMGMGGMPTAANPTGGGGGGGGGMLGSPIVVSFTYEKTLPDGKVATCKLSVPFLTMVPIPNLRIEECNIQFNARINNMRKSENSSVSTAKMKGYITTKETKSMNSTEKTYSLSVSVRAKQDELPAGMEKILSILESAIKEQSNANDKGGGGGAGPDGAQPQGN